MSSSFTKDQLDAIEFGRKAMIDAWRAELDLLADPKYSQGARSGAQRLISWWANMTRDELAQHAFIQTLLVQVNEPLS